MNKTMNLNDDVKKIMEAAEKSGAETNFFYLTTLNRYQTQMKMMEDLKKSYLEHGPTVEKEYVKGRKNLTVNPAITEYNKTANAANQTVQTLLKIVQALGATSIMDVEEDDEM